MGASRKVRAPTLPIVTRDWKRRDLAGLALRWVSRTYQRYLKVSPGRTRRP
jgi:hypothetical protein